MGKPAIGILEVDHFAEADLGDEIVVEKDVGRGGYGEQYERSPEEENCA
jgi:hypothetical protein